MRVLLDINVVLDAVLGRRPHSQAAAKLWFLAETRRIQAFIPAHGVTTIYYLLARHRDAVSARRAVASIVAVFGVATVGEAVIRRALDLAWPDFEDAVCAAAAEAAGCEMLVTRDPTGFPSAPLSVVDPQTAAALLGGTGPERVGEAAGKYGPDGRRRETPGPRARRVPARKPR